MHGFLRAAEAATCGDFLPAPPQNSDLPAAARGSAPLPRASRWPPARVVIARLCGSIAQRPGARGGIVPRAGSGADSRSRWERERRGKGESRESELRHNAGRERARRARGWSIAAQLDAGRGCARSRGIDRAPLEFDWETGRPQVDAGLRGLRAG